MGRQRWQITQTRFDLDADGYGEVIYRIQTPQARYHVVIFSRYLDDSERSDRVIAEAWDLTFGLVEGDVEDDLNEMKTDETVSEEYLERLITFYQNYLKGFGCELSL